MIHCLNQTVNRQQETIENQKNEIQKLQEDLDDYLVTIGELNSQLQATWHELENLKQIQVEGDPENNNKQNIYM